jgi:F-type H+-transporting ATPase subunit c
LIAAADKTSRRRILMNRKLIQALLTGLVLLALALPVFAQGEAGATTTPQKGDWMLLTVGFMAIAAAGCGYAQSKALTAACEGVSRNPGATDTIRIFTFLGLAMIEFLALLTFIAFFMLYLRK